MLFLGVTSGVVGLGVVAGLYAIGYLVDARRARRLADAFADAGHAPTSRKGLEQLLASIRFRVADDVFQKVGSIAHSIVQTLPDNGADSRSGRSERQPDPPDGAQSICLRRSMRTWPSRGSTPSGAPSTAARPPTTILMDQLNLMDSKMQEAADASPRTTRTGCSPTSASCRSASPTAPSSWPRRATARRRRTREFVQMGRGSWAHGRN